MSGNKNNNKDKISSIKKDVVFVIKEEIIDLNDLIRLDDMVKVKVFIKNGQKIGDFTLKDIKKKFLGNE